ncbi:11198_t:CDS:2, partial [Scutellospora calospora]
LVKIYYEEVIRFFEHPNYCVVLDIFERKYELDNRHIDLVSDSTSVYLISHVLEKIGKLIAVQAKHKLSSISISTDILKRKKK